MKPLVGVAVTVYVVDWPALRDASGGVAVIEKSCKKIFSERLAVFAVLVPVTAKFRGFAVSADRPLTVRTELWPGMIEAGLNEHVAPEQARPILDVKLLAADAEIVKVVEAVPTRMLLDKLLAESVKTPPPAPDSKTDCGLPAALSVIMSVPAADPDLVGVKVMLSTQLAPALRMLGCTPHVLVSLKSPVALMALIVIAEVPELTTSTT